LLEIGLQKLDGAPFAVTQLARLTGDRTRDVSETARHSAMEALRAAQVPTRWVQMMEQVLLLEPQDEARALGDTLPRGLSLL
jgi:hypothetical protein